MVILYNSQPYLWKNLLQKKSCQEDPQEFLTEKQLQVSKLKELIFEAAIQYRSGDHYHQRLLSRIYLQGNTFHLTVRINNIITRDLLTAMSSVR